MVKVIKKMGVVGIVDSDASRRIAQELSPGAVAWLEWRADCLDAIIPTVAFPWILTVRHPAEGGKRKLSVTQRRGIFLDLLPQATAVDIEMRSLKELSEVVQVAKCEGKKLIVSYHDFCGSPDAQALRDILRRGEDAGADIIKIASTTRHAADVALLLALFTQTDTPLALMGMGTLGLASRLLFACCGSVLNYGWLAKPNVSGQWSAAELTQLLHRVES